MHALMQTRSQKLEARSTLQLQVLTDVQIQMYRIQMLQCTVRRQNVRSQTRKRRQTCRRDHETTHSQTARGRQLRILYFSFRCQMLDQTTITIYNYNYNYNMTSNMTADTYFSRLTSRSCSSRQSTLKLCHDTLPSPLHPHQLHRCFHFHSKMRQCRLPQ